MIGSGKKKLFKIIAVYDKTEKNIFKQSPFIISQEKNIFKSTVHEKIHVYDILKNHRLR